MERIDVCLDPGHGGTRWTGRSSPFGVRGRAGTLEKDVVLRIAERIAAHLADRRVVLTRRADENRSLAERAAIAAQGSARAFVSIHANAGAAGERGPEIWVHPRADRNSEVLAAEVQRVLAGAVDVAAGMRRGEMAVLDPRLHVPDTAACLIEVDYLTHAESEQRLRDVASIDRLGRAIAEGVRSYLDGGKAHPAGAGRGPPLRGRRERALATTVVDLFPSANILSLDMANATFTTCIEDASQAADVKQLCGAVVDLTDDGSALPPYVGHNDTDMLYVGSLAKIYPLLAAFQLRKSLTDQAQNMIIDEGLSTDSPGWEDKVFGALRKGWQPQLDARFPPPLRSGFPSLAQIFQLSADGRAEFRDEFLGWITLALQQNDEDAAGKYIRALSYPYINGVLAAAGFFKPDTKTGLWISGDYNGNDWLPKDAAGQPLTPRWRSPGHPVSNFAGTALQISRFLCLMAQGLLVEGVRSTDMIPLLGVPWLVQVLQGAPRDLSSASGKVGIGTWDGRYHDGAIATVDRATDPDRPIRYVVVVLGSPGGIDALGKLEIAWHDCVVARHP